MQTPKRKPAKYAGKKPDPYITLEKYHRLELELDRLKAKGPEAKSEVRRLALDGDFSENAAYQMAKGRLRGLNQRIADIEDHLKRAEIIEENKSTDRVVLGAQVTVKASGREKTYKILGSSEADPARNIISHNSPLGAALIGKSVGDTIKIKSAQKPVEYKIIRIE